LIGREHVIGKTVREVLPEIAEQGFVDVLDRVYASAEPDIGPSPFTWRDERTSRPSCAGSTSSTSRSPRPAR
jgi:hypothetical protein